MSDDARDKAEKTVGEESKVSEVIKDLAGTAQEGAKQLVLLMRKSFEGKHVVTNPGEEGFSIKFENEGKGDRAEKSPIQDSPVDKPAGDKPEDKKLPSADKPEAKDIGDKKPEEKNVSGDAPLGKKPEASDSGAKEKDIPNRNGDVDPQAIDGGQKPPTRIEYPNKSSRNVEYDAQGQPVRINYDDPAHNFKDTWERVPGTGLWYQRDADGNVTGKLFAGEVTVSKDGEVKYKVIGDKDSTVETTDGGKFRETEAGARIKDEGSKREITYANNTRAEVSYDDKGNLSEVVLPDGTKLRNTGDQWVAVDEKDNPIEGGVFSDVQVGDDGKIVVTDAGENKLQINGNGSQTEIHADGSKLEYDPEGRVQSVTYPAPRTDSIKFEYNDPEHPNQPTSVDLSNGTKWTRQQDGTWIDKTTGAVWEGAMKVEVDGTFSSQVKGSDVINTQYANGSRMTSEGDTHVVETPNGSSLSYEGNKLTEVSYPNGVTRTFGKYENGQPTEIIYENAKTGTHETWRKEGDSHWVQYDKDGKPGREWNGDISVDKQTGAYIYHESNTSKYVNELPNGAVLTSADGSHISEVKAANGDVTTLEWDSEIGVKSYTDKTGHWKTDDGLHWTNDNGQKKTETVTVDGEGTISHDDGKSVVYAHTDNSRMVREATGGKRIYDDKGHLTETVDANNKVYRYGYDDAGNVNSVTDPEGKVWTTDNGTDWTTQDGSQKWTGEVKVDQRDGSLTYTDKTTQKETVVRTDGSETATDRDPGSASFGKVMTTDKDGNKKVDVPPVDQNQIAKAAEAFHAAAHGWTGADPKGMQDQLDGKTEAERYAMDQWYIATYGISLAQEIDSRLTGADEVKTRNLFYKQDGVDDNAGFVSENLAEIGDLGVLEQSKVPAIEKELRLKVSSMNAEEIAAMNAEHAKYDPEHRTAIEAIMQNPNISQATKDAIAIYAKGKENLTDADYRKIADSAIANKDLDSFEEAMSYMSTEARRAFREDDGVKKAYDAFSGTFTSTQFEQSLDYMAYGELSLGQEIVQNTGTVKDDVGAIESAIKNMSDEGRKLYNEGQKIANERGADVDVSTLPPAQQEAFMYFKQTQQALHAAGNDMEVKRWEAMIQYGDNALFNDAASHRGSVSDDSIETVLKGIDQMSKKDWELLKKDPDYRAKLEELYGTYLSATEMQRVTEALDVKQKADSYEAAASAHVLPLKDAIIDAFTGQGFDPAKVMDAISHMTPQEQEDYRNNKDGVRDLVQFATKAPSELAKAAEYIGGKIDRGENVTEDIVVKLYKHGTLETLADEGLTVSEIQKAFKEDPSLRERILNPKTDSDRELAQHFKDAAEEAIGSWDYDKYVRPLVENGYLSAESVRDLYTGTFDDDELGFYQSLENMPADELAKMAQNPDSYLGFLNAEEREVALKVIAQGGKMLPEDMIRAYQLGAGTMEQPIKDLLAGMTPEQIEQMKKDYAQKYKADLTADVMSELGGQDARDVRKMMARPKSAGEEFNDALEDYASTRGSGRSGDYFSGTGATADDVMTQYAKAMGEYAAAYEKMPPEVQKEFQNRLDEALKANRDFKSALVDFAVNITAMAAAAVGAIPTGGASLGVLAALGTAGGALKVAAKTAMLGDDYDIESDGAADFATGAVDAATATIGPAGAAGFGEKIAAKTAATLTSNAAIVAKDVAVTAIEQDIKAAVTEAVKSGAKEISEATLASIANKYAKAGAEAEFKAALKQSIEKEVAEEVKQSAAKLAAEYAETMAYGGAGGALSGAAGAATKIDADKGITKNVQDVLAGTASGAASGVLAAAVFHTVSKGIGALKAKPDVPLKVADGPPADGPGGHPPSDATPPGTGAKAENPAGKPGSPSDKAPDASKPANTKDKVSTKETNAEEASSSASDSNTVPKSSPDTPADTAGPTPGSEGGLPVKDQAKAPGGTPDTVTKVTPDTVTKPANDVASKPESGTGSEKPVSDGPGKPRKDPPGKLLRKKPGEGSEPAPEPNTTKPKPQPDTNKPSESDVPSQSDEDYQPGEFFTEPDIPAINSFKPSEVSDTELELEAVLDTLPSVKAVDPSTADTRIDIPALTPESGFKKPGSEGSNSGKLPDEIAKAKPQLQPAPPVDPGPAPFKDTLDAGADVIPDGVSPGTIPEIFLKEGAPDRMVVTAQDPLVVLKEDAAVTLPDGSVVDEITIVESEPIGSIDAGSVADISSGVKPGEASVTDVNIPAIADSAIKAQTEAPPGDVAKPTPEAGNKKEGGTEQKPVTDGPGKPRKDQPGKLMRKKPGENTEEPASNVVPPADSTPPQPAPKPVPDTPSSEINDPWLPKPGEQFFTDPDIPAVQFLKPSEVSDTELELEAIYNTLPTVKAIDPSTADTRIDIPALTPETGFKKPDVASGKLPKDIPTANPAEQQPKAPIDPGPAPFKDTLEPGADEIPPGVSPGTIPEIFLKEGAPDRMVITAKDPAVVAKEQALADATKFDGEEDPTGVFEGQSKLPDEEDPTGVFEGQSKLPGEEDPTGVSGADTADDITFLREEEYALVEDKSDEVIVVSESDIISVTPIDDGGMGGGGDGGAGGVSGDTQVIKLAVAKKPPAPEISEDLAKKIAAAESSPLPKPDINAKPAIKNQIDYGIDGEYGSEVEMEINGTSVKLSRPGSEGFYYGKKLSAKDNPVSNKVHIEAADVEELAKMQAVVIPALENDPALRDLVANWKTIDPRLTTSDGKWGVPEVSQGTVGPPSKQVSPGDRGQDAKAFTIYVKDKAAADAVAKRIDEILDQYPEFQNKDVVPTGNSDTVVGDTNRVGVVKDHLPKAPGSTPDRPQAKLDDAIADSIKSDKELAARARQNGVSVLAQLENEIGLKSGTLHEDAKGNIVIDLPPQKPRDFNQYENNVYLDESEAEKSIGELTARPAVYAVYKHYGYDPKDF